jgi:hypothetical protein
MMKMVDTINSTIAGAAEFKSGTPITKVECVTCHHNVAKPEQLTGVLSKTMLTKGEGLGDPEISRDADAVLRFTVVRLHRADAARLDSSRSRRTSRTTRSRFEVESGVLSESRRRRSSRCRRPGYAKNDSNGAIKDLEEALKIQPDNMQAKRQLEQLKAEPATNVKAQGSGLRAQGSGSKTRGLGESRGRAFCVYPTAPRRRARRAPPRPGAGAAPGAPPRPAAGKVTFATSSLSAVPRIFQLEVDLAKLGFSHFTVDSAEAATGTAAPANVMENCLLLARGYGWHLHTRPHRPSPAGERPEAPAALPELAPHHPRVPRRGPPERAEW